MGQPRLEKNNLSRLGVQFSLGLPLLEKPCNASRVIKKELSHSANNRWYHVLWCFAVFSPRSWVLCCALWSEDDRLRLWLIWSDVSSQHFHLIYQLGVNVSRWAGRLSRCPNPHITMLLLLPSGVQSMAKDSYSSTLAPSTKPVILICKWAGLFKC